MLRGTASLELMLCVGFVLATLGLTPDGDRVEERIS